MSSCFPLKKHLVLSEEDTVPALRSLGHEKVIASMKTGELMSISFCFEPPAHQLEICNLDFITRLSKLERKVSNDHV